VRTRLFIILAATLVLLFCAVGIWRKWSQPTPEPPRPDLTGADTEVIEAIQDARNDVLKESTASSWGRLGEVLLAHDFNVEANYCLAQAEKLDPANPAWPYLQGLNLIVHDPEAGIPHLEQAVQRSVSDQVAPRLLLAEVLLERHRADEAESLLRQVRKTAPNDLRARLGLGRVALLRDDLRTALDHFQACQTDAHCRKRAYALSAEARARVGESEEAQTDLRMAAELPNDQPWPDPYYDEVVKLRRGQHARLMLVEYLINSRQMNDAVRQLEETVKRYPQSLEAWMRLGDLMYQHNKLEQAETCFKKVVAAAPDMAEAWARLGSVQVRLRPRQAVESLREAIRLKSDHAGAHYNLGQCLLHEFDDRAGAAEEFRTALRSRPDYELARTALTKLESKEGKSP
jgi:tetratricopeptide (TPR) repeat protein